MEIKIRREYGIALHYQIRKEIEKLIKREDFTSIPLPQEEKLAEKFKVSRGTVRRAISDLVNQGLLYRIPGKGTFVNKKSLSIEKITIFSPWHLHPEPEIAQNTYEDILLSALRNTIVGRNFSLILKNFEKEEIEFVNVTKESAGIIILNPKRNQKEIVDRISKFSLPSVFIGANLRRKDVNYVTVDNRNGTRKAVEYLIKLGHKKIFFIIGSGSLNSYDNWERYEAFKEICEEKKISFEIKILEKANWREEILKFIEEINKKKNFPDGIITPNVTISLYVMEGIKKIKKKIPHDLSLISFDDFPICEHLNPPLTTISQPIKLLAEKGFEILLEKINNPETKPKQIILPTELISRNSCKERRW